MAGASGRRALAALAGPAPASRPGRLHHRPMPAARPPQASRPAVARTEGRGVQLAGRGLWLGQRLSCGLFCSAACTGELYPCTSLLHRRLVQTAVDYDINTRTKPHLNIGTIGHVDHGKNHSHCGDYTSGFNQLSHWCCLRVCNVYDVLRQVSSIPGAVLQPVLVQVLSTFGRSKISGF